MPVIENLQLVLAVCRIGIYSLWKKIICQQDAAPRPEFEVICIGLDDAGKTTLLTLLAGEPATDVQPTKGFVIKIVQLKDCILNVKEIGGGEKVRNYWSRYYQGAEAIIFVVNSSGDVDKAADCLHQALLDPTLNGLPLLVLANCQDKPDAMKEDELESVFDLEDVCQDREHQLITCSKEDIPQLTQKIQEFCARCLIKSEDKSSPQEEPSPNQQ